MSEWSTPGSGTSCAETSTGESTRSTFRPRGTHPVFFIRPKPCAGSWTPSVSEPKRRRWVCCSEVLMRRFATHLDLWSS